MVDWGAEPLKRVPKPYDADHPHGDLLRRKSFTLTYDLPGGWRETGLVKACGEGVKAMVPVAEVLRG